MRTLIISLAVSLVATLAIGALAPSIPDGLATLAGLAVFGLSMFARELSR